MSTKSPGIRLIDIRPQTVRPVLRKPIVSPRTPSSEIPLSARALELLEIPRILARTRVRQVHHVRLLPSTLLGGSDLGKRYPTCLVYLTLLQVQAFRDRLGDRSFIDELKRVGARHHETW